MNLFSASLSIYGSRNDVLQQKYLLLADLYEKKHWHQFTDILTELVENELCRTDENLILLYQDVLVKCESKLNPIRLVGIVEIIARQHLHSNPPTVVQVDKALAFMEAFSNKSFLGPEAKIMAQMVMAQLLLQSDRRASALDLITAVAPQVRSLEGTGAESQVKSAFHLAETMYYKQAGPAGAFYRSAIQYLAHTPGKSLSKDARLALAVDVSLAALVAEDVYNFGEVLHQQIVGELEHSPAHMWIYGLLQVFNEGDVLGFNRLVDANRAAFEATPALRNQAQLLKQKVALLCLMKLVFDRPPHARSIPFAEIAAACRLDDDQVEWLAMRALSQGLIRGQMDQVKHTLHVSWLMPRVLDSQQVRVLDEKLVHWTAKVDEALKFEAPLAEFF